MIVDWKPFDYFTEQQTGIPLKLTGYNTTHLAPIPEGTQVKMVFSGVTSSSAVLGFVAKFLAPIIRQKVRSDYVKMFARLQEMLERDDVPKAADSVKA